MKWKSVNSQWVILKKLFLKLSKLLQTVRLERAFHQQTRLLNSFLKNGLAYILNFKMCGSFELPVHL